MFLRRNCSRVAETVGPLEWLSYHQELVRLASNLGVRLLRRNASRAWRREIPPDKRFFRAVLCGVLRIIGTVFFERSIMPIFPSKRPPSTADDEVLVAEVVNQPASQLPRRLAMGVSLLVALFLGFNYAKRYNLIPATLGGDAPKAQLAAMTPPATAKQQSESGVQETVLKPAPIASSEPQTDKPVVTAATPGPDPMPSVAPSAVTPVPIVVSEAKVVKAAENAAAVPASTAVTTPVMAQQKPAATSPLAAVPPAMASATVAQAAAPVAVAAERAAHPAKVPSALARKDRQTTPDSWQEGKRFF
ncbi:MAG: hypothetical protein OEL20_05500 [Sulfuritalea sp.]|nr:hypothetical protein [Sulfuritalea sp.]